MEKPLSLTILYTSNIRGNIHMLPHLYTFIQTLKPDERQGTLMLDLGNSCAEGVWHCDITHGRSTLMVLDAMGYHAANVEKQLDSENRDKVAEVVTMGLVDDTHEWGYYIPPVTDESIQATLNPSQTGRLQICLQPADSTYINGNALYLADVLAKQIGIVRVDLHESPIVNDYTVYTLPTSTHPNPTIVASVEFVESEARYFQRKQANDGTDI